MEKQKKKAVVAFNNRDYAEHIAEMVQHIEPNYDIAICSSFDDLVRIAKSEVKQEEHTDLHLMDANYGKNKAPIAEPAQIIYSWLESLVKQGKTNFMSLTEDVLALADAKSKGVPCMDKTNHKGLVDYLLER